MAEWTIQVQTPPATTDSSEAFEAFQASLSRNELAADVAALFDEQEGTFSATFQVDAETEQEAALQGCFAYWRALSSAGIRPQTESHVPVSLGAPSEAGEIDE